MTNRPNRSARMERPRPKARAEQREDRPLLIWLFALLLLALAVTIGAATRADEQPLPRQKHFDEYVVHHSAVQASRMPDVVLREHGIDDERDAIILNIALRDRDEQKNLRADVNVNAINRLQQLEPVEVDMVEAGEPAGLFSYAGVLDVALPATITFEVEVEPAGPYPAHRFEFSESFGAPPPAP